MQNLTWGLDGFGDRHYLCAHCNKVFGKVDPDKIKHKCKIDKIGVLNNE